MIGCYQLASERKLKMAGIDGFTQCVRNAFQKYVETGDFFTLASEWSDCIDADV